MDENNPLVSIIVRTKDRPALLKTALRSVASQDYRPIEVTLINDGGCDLDLDIIRSILNDVSLNYVRFENNKGRAASGNAGILNAHGKYIGFLDDDDEFRPDHISTLVSFLEQSDCRVAYADSELVVLEVDAALGKSEIKDRRVFSSYDFFYKDLLMGNYISLISILFSAEVLKTSGGFDESLDLYEDWDLLLRIGSDYPFSHIKKVTSLYNQWSGSAQIAQSAKTDVIKASFSRVIEKHYEKITAETILNLKDKENVLTVNFKKLVAKYIRLENALADRNSELNQKYSELSQKNSELLRKHDELLQKDSELSRQALQISALRGEKDLLKSRIEEMLSTLGWRFFDKVRIIRDHLLPSGTGRRHVYQKVVARIKGATEDRAISASQDLEPEEVEDFDGSGAQVGAEVLDEEKEEKAHASESVVENPNEVLAGERPVAADEGEIYETWIRKNEPDDAGLQKQREESMAFLYRPLISLVVPVYETDRDMLTKMLDSVLAQTYENWQLCIAEGNSSMSYIREILRSYADRDGRIQIKFLEENRHISGNSNEALSLAEGEFVGFLDHDDELAPPALYEVVRLLNERPGLDIIYSDEDKLDVEGKRSFPFFKPDWSPALLLSVNYICHFAAMRHSIVRELSGFRKGYDGAQDYDLFLRASRVTSRIYHIPKILYHWREHEKSTLGDDSRKDYADTSGKAALADFFRSSRIDAYVESGLAKTNYLVRYAIKGNPLISIIIPFRDKVELLRKCVRSILEKTTYEEYELLLVSNKSTEFETFHYLDSLGEYEKIRILKFEEEFNFSKINNYAVREASGDYLLFLNNDTEILSEGWLTYMLEHAQRDEVGAVGCKLLFPDQRIQHAGVVIGMTGLAGHVFAGLPDHSYSYLGSSDFVRNVMAVTGACMMVKREIFKRAGGFNDSFVVCGSDVDLCIRIHKMGYRNVYTPHAVLYHHESASRDSHIPSNDFELSLESYRDFLSGRDPYYNPNLTLMKTDCSLKREGEEKLLKEIRENAIKQSREAGDSTKKERYSKTAETINLVEALDFSVSDLNVSTRLMSDFGKNRPDVRSINWFIPYFHHVYYGGIHTILRFADYLSRKGIRNRFVLYDSPEVSQEDILNKIGTAFPHMRQPEVFVRRDADINSIPYADISVATLWTSAYRLLKFRKTTGKFYFIQDYEPLFYPAGTCYALAEATYRFGFYGIVNTPGLYDFVTNKHEMTAEYFVPAVDHHIFFPAVKASGREGEKLKLFFYGRPQHDRNAFDLAVAAAKKIKATLGNRIEIVSAGSEWNPEDFGIEGTITNLGLLGYEETAELYRSCDFGLILMFTKHPSYLPMELMASGAIVISNYNDANTWLLKDKINCAVVEPSPTYITERLLYLIKDEELQKTMRENARSTAASYHWDNEMEKIYRFITGTGKTYDVTSETGDGRAGGHTVEKLSREIDAVRAEMKGLVDEAQMLRGELRAKSSYLDDIHNSFGWKLLNFYRKRIKERMLPMGTRREQTYRLVLKGMHAVYVYGLRITLHKAVSKLRSRLVSKRIKQEKFNLPMIANGITKTVDKKISVIIPTKDAGSEFKITMEKIKNQKGLGELELIIIDSGSKDDTLIIAEHYGAKVSCINPEEFNHGRVRNIGAEISTGDYLVFLSQDAIPIGETCIFDMIRVLEKDDRTAVAVVKQVPRSDADIFACWQLWYHYNKLLDPSDNQIVHADPDTFAKLSPTDRRKISQIDNVFSCIKRDIFFRFKFKPLPYAEDLDLGLRLISGGYKVAFIFSLGVIHSHNRNPDYFFRRSYVDTRSISGLLGYEPIKWDEQGICSIKDMVSLVLTFYSRINLAIDMLQRNNLNGSTKTLFNTVKSSLWGEQTGTGSAGERTLNNLLERLVSTFRGETIQNSGNSGILINQFIDLIDSFGEFLGAYDEIIDKREEFVMALYKFFALVAGSNIGNFAIYLEQKNPSDPALAWLENSLSEGV